MPDDPTENLKPSRVVDPQAVARARKRYCELCSVVTDDTLDPHHVRSRGAGGPDTDENLLSLCRQCHTKVHIGLISRATILEAIARRDTAYDYPEINPAQATSPFFSVRLPPSITRAASSNTG